MVCKDCCCDKCNDWRLDCGCCRCVPQRMCATLRDEYDEDPASHAIAAQGVPIYKFSIPVDDDYGSIDILLSLVTLDEYCDPDDPEEEENRCCRWRVESDYLGMDEYYEVRGYEGVGCSSKTFSLDIDSDEGTIEIRPHIHGEVEVVESENGRCKEPFCGDCRCVCKTICVIETIAGVPSSLSLYEWDEESRSWGGEYGFSLIKDEYTGQCLISTGGFDPVEIDCPNVSATIDDGSGNGFEVSCWDCKCEEVCECCPGVSVSLAATIDIATSTSSSCPELVIQNLPDQGLNFNYGVEDVPEDACSVWGQDGIIPTGPDTVDIRVYCFGSGGWYYQYRWHTLGGPADPTWTTASLENPCPDCYSGSSVMFDMVIPATCRDCDSSYLTLEQECAGLPGDPLPDFTIVLTGTIGATCL